MTFQRERTEVAFSCLVSSFVVFVLCCLGLVLSCLVLSGLSLILSCLVFFVLRCLCVIYDVLKPPRSYKIHVCRSSWRVETKRTGAKGPQRQIGEKTERRRQRREGKSVEKIGARRQS
jgi:hypothetical protein